jgi:hypothetical protein
MTELVVRPHHIRAAKICMKGARAWYEQNNLPWSECIGNGTPVSIIEATGCPIAARAVAEARKEAAGG